MRSIRLFIRSANVALVLAYVVLAILTGHGFFFFAAGYFARATMVEW